MIKFGMSVNDLPADVATLQRMLIAEREARAAQAAELAAAKAGLVSKTLEIEKLKVQIARLRRQQFGRSSEKIDRIIEQLELMLDELETEAAVGPTTVGPVAAPVTDEDDSAAVRVAPHEIDEVARGTHGAGDEMRVGFESRVAAHVDDQRRAGGAELGMKRRHERRG